MCANLMFTYNKILGAIIAVIWAAVYYVIGTRFGEASAAFFMVLGGIAAMATYESMRRK